ncbi:MAG: menaquinone biosynthesis decarboxylase [Armatimonadetes bacterium CG_4_10_14_0_8_um_filter_66_14]|nr:menaquinone biosynthesis decarboxylase [Armatimonadota bacterium]OIP11397.1 MAG: menaquinone biosynthesis decarboxylase [Armatimonadetes bacterium CG2_30_66_41]PIX38838.1 MAG: menaquinone biosynthesis decarboxylase [Armatimonadetes bacterium CG_4_8_14_3_um_filter_66_20]PIZ47659.1 MAG: menaquinone biosynthesis decarboxylase [Armatimonadetes bacterium CG_4_10_14_0_8_um_filter_66_14]PJB61121.1 MAG: menaquinone biosynthesis decarboxylase [Armatimonadetes bacterium CG_4_9_14_3_um_filter_66_14]
MAYRDLKHFVDVLRQRGELKEISVEVDPVLEISEIADRVVKAGGPALLFTNVKGHRIPVLINAFGTLERMALALGAESLDAIAEDIAELLEPQMPVSLIGKLQALPKLKRFLSLPPKTVRSGACQEVVETDSPSLAEIPIIQCWPQDGGKYITLPLVFTKHPELGTRNVGMYRLQKFDDRTLGMHWQRHKGGAAHYRVAERLGKRLDVAVALGPDPAVTYAATAPLPDEVDELMLAGFLRDAPVELVQCRTVDLEVPANAQIVLEGYVEPGERRLEGPFGDHTGFYSLDEEYPVFHLTAVTHCRDPIYPTIIVGRPPMEDGPLGKATERLFLPLIKKSVPEIVDMNLPVEGIFHNFAIVSLDKRYPGHARKVMHAIWGLGQLMFTKVVIVVDKQCNVHDLGEVMWRVGTAIDPKRDVVFAEGPCDVLDFAAQVPDYGTKMGIDATRKWPDEGFTGRWPDEIEMLPEVKKRVAGIWSELGLDG